MAADYRRWQLLHDRQQAGQPLSPADVAELRELSDSLPAARHELELLRALGQLACERDPDANLSIVEHALDRVRQVDKVVFIGNRAAKYSASVPLAQGYARGWVTVGLGGLLILLVAVGAAWFTSKDTGSGLEPRATSQGVVAAPTSVELTFAAGSVRVNDNAAEVTALALRPSATLRVADGRACFDIDTTADVCLGPNTTVVLDDQQGSARNVHLLQGHAVAVLAKRDGQHAFSIESAGVRATALGTVFAVERAPGSGPIVTVLEGRVRVQHAQVQQTVVADEQVSAVEGGLGETRRITRVEQSRQAALVEVRRLWKQPTVAMLQVQAAPTEARLSLDGISVGRPPLSLVLGTGHHQLTAELAGKPQQVLPFQLEPGQVQKLRLSLESEPVAAPTASTKTVARSPSAAVNPSEAQPSAEELLGKARRLVRAGDWPQAVAAYRHLVQLYPGSPESHTVLVALGQLELDRLGQPAQALVSFNRYLKGGGGLAQEASFGKIRALRSLGRHAEERLAVLSYLARYPDSADTGALKRRLAQLESSEPSAQ